MSFDAPYVGFVLMSYGLSALVLAGLVGFYLWRAHWLERRVAQISGERGKARSANDE